MGAPGYMRGARVTLLFRWPSSKCEEVVVYGHFCSRCLEGVFAESKQAFGACACTPPENNIDTCM